MCELLHSIKQIFEACVYVHVFFGEWTVVENAPCKKNKHKKHTATMDLRAVCIHAIPQGHGLILCFYVCHCLHIFLNIIFLHRTLKGSP